MIDRVPIQTFVTEHNDEVIREAINRELARGGQVYYVYNRVRSIDEAAAHIQELVPQANVALPMVRWKSVNLKRLWSILSMVI